MYLTRVSTTSKDGLETEEWTYNLQDSVGSITLKLSHYIKQSRKTKRHAWKTIEYWDRLDKRNNTIVYTSTPDWVEDQAIQNLLDNLKVE